MKTMRRLARTTLCALAIAALGSGCGTTGGLSDGRPSDTRDGKCHGPDYNAPGCLYLF